jgi:hypothetical protein
MKQVELYGRVRNSILIEGINRGKTVLNFGVDVWTVDKMLLFAVPPGYGHVVRRRRVAFEVQQIRQNSLQTSPNVRTNSFGRSPSIMDLDNGAEYGNLTASTHPIWGIRDYTLFSL